MLSFLKKIIDFFLFGNLFISLGAYCLVYSTTIQLPICHNRYYAFLVFFATLFIYNLQRIFYNKPLSIQLQSNRRMWVFKNQILIKILAGIGFCGICVLYFYNSYKVIFYLSPLFILSLFYFLPFIRLRKRAWFKITTLSLVWTIATSVVPILLMNKGVIENIFFLHIATRFCFIVAICILFDIRDMEVDKNENVFTLPVLYGENKSKIIAVAFMLIYIFFFFLDFYFEIFKVKIFFELLISALINTVLVFMTNSKRSEYFYAVLLDGTMIVQGGLLVMANAI